MSRLFALGILLLNLACAGPNGRSAKNGWIYVAGSPYIIDEHGVSKAGWRLRCPWVDHELLFAYPSQMVPIDEEGVFISATRPEVWFIGRKSVSQQPPPQDQLKETVLAISKGDCLLTLIDLSGKNDIQMLTCDEE